jgi:hypothetical protein
LYDRYVEQAEAAGTDTLSLMTERLARCSEHSAVKGIYLGDAERQQLDAALDYNHSTATDVVERVLRALGSIQVNGDSLDEPVTITLNPRQLERIRGVCHYGTPIAERIKQLTLDGINQSIGLV